MNQIFFNLLRELDFYDQVLGKILYYQENIESYQQVEEGLEFIIKTREDVMSALANTLKAYTSRLKEQVLARNTKQVPLVAYEHIKFLDSKLVEFNKYYKDGGYDRLMKQSLKRRKECPDDRAREKAINILVRIEERRLEIEGVRHSLLMRLCNAAGAGASFTIAGLIVTPLAVRILPQKITRYRNRRKKIDTKKIIKSIADKKIKLEEIDTDMKNCENASLEHARKGDTMPTHDASCKSLYFPEGWSEGYFTYYKNPMSVTSSKKRKRKINFSISSIVNSFKQSTVETKPDKPWEVDIAIGHQCIKPVYRKNRTMSDNNNTIVAYSFFDKEELNKTTHFTHDEINKISEIHESSGFAPHEHGATGYKRYNFNYTDIWEFKIAGEKRLYGLTVNTTSEGRRKKEEGRRKKEEGRRKKEEGRRKKEEGRKKGKNSASGCV